MKKKLIIVCVLVALLAVVIMLGNLSKYQSSQSDTNSNIQTVEEIYSKLSIDITPLAKLPEKYSIYDAIEDGYLVIMGNKYNDQSQNEFMESYNKKEKAFIRVAKLTDEGDLILYDIIYLPEQDKVYVVTDYSRDKFSSKENRAISFKEYDKLAVNYDGKKCWIAYNGDLSKVKNEDVFYIVAI